MLIKVSCPSCSEMFAADSAECGHTVNCPSCSSEFPIPLQESLEVGNIIDDHIIKEFIGKGSMGFVYLAEHLLMNRQVALKTISPDQLHAEGTVDLFIKEVQNSAALQHPNIVTTYNAGCKNNIFFITMQYVEGSDLSDIVDKEKKLNEKKSFQLAKEIAQALSYAWNDHNMIHRDIKPENIRYNTKGRYLVMDFGLAMQGGIDDSGYINGTPDFMSPEQATMKEVDFHTDMYSLGLTMIYALTGKRVFQGTPQEVLQMQVSAPIPSLSELAPNQKFSAKIQNIISKMTAKNPSDRYESWEQLISRLDKALDNDAPQKPKKKKNPNAIKANKATVQHTQAANKSIRRQSGGMAFPVYVFFCIMVFVSYLYYIGRIPDFLNLM
ncbi:protein kinase [Lentisphaera profundi]|uniref:mitogen-activated protein kinase kinase n=1 Tax=Lentisphaera profundi TaxID=1658616 RepID=A0ABY7VUC1_9BACT|nr:protein kinase [Lentisphaera profundi]WDE97486.1 protein kinase [Lentisphaera profundi]